MLFSCFQVHGTIHDDKQRNFLETTKVWQRLCGFQTSCEKIKGPSPVELEKNTSTLWPLPKMSGFWGLVVVWSKESRSRLKTKQNMLSCYLCMKETSRKPNHFVGTLDTRIQMAGLLSSATLLVEAATCSSNLRQISWRCNWGSMTMWCSIPQTKAP